MRSTRTAAAAAALLSLTLLAGCGGGGDDKSSDKKTVTVTETPTPTETPTTEATSSPTTSETPMDPTGDVTQEQVEAALLTAADVGSGFVDGTYTDTDDPPPCDPTGQPLDQQVPPQVQAGTEIDHSSIAAAFQEEITIYASDDEAANAFTIGTNGLNCTDGTTSDGTKVKIDPPQDVSATVDPSGAASSTAYTFTGDGYEGVLIVTLAHRVIMVVTAQGATDADTSSLPNPVDIAAAAWQKALAN